MSLKYHGPLRNVNGSLVALDGVKNVGLRGNGGSRLWRAAPRRNGRVVQIDGDRRAIIQVFEGTRGISLENTTTPLHGHPMEHGPIQGNAGPGLRRRRPARSTAWARSTRRSGADINGQPLNPVSRKYPRSCIYTGISAIDGLTHPDPRAEAAHLLRFRYAAQQAGRPDRAAGQGAPNEDEEFGIVFAAMGVKNDVADYFRRSFEETGVMEPGGYVPEPVQPTPIIERILTPRCALTAAEYPGL